jgi:hypothetical protein
LLTMRTAAVVHALGMNLKRFQLFFAFSASVLEPSEMQAGGTEKSVLRRSSFPPNVIAFFPRRTAAPSRSRRPLPRPAAMRS